MESLSYAIRADERFYQQTYARRRKDQWWRQWSWTIRYPMAALLLFVTIRSLEQEDIGHAVVMGTVAVVIVFAPWLDHLILSHRLEKSPFLGELANVRLDDEGIHGDASLSTGSVVWSACTEAVEFVDGVLIYHGPTMFRWMPHSALQNGAKPDEAAAFIQRHVENYRKR